MYIYISYMASKVGLYIYSTKKETSRGAFWDRYISTYRKYICIWYHNKP